MTLSVDQNRENLRRGLITGKFWRFRSMADPARCRNLAAELNLPAPLVTLLLQRGLQTQEEIHSFLHPSLHHIPAPGLLKGMDEAVGLLAPGILAGRPIAVYGDYDADGVCSTALLVSFFRDIGLAPSFFLPHRLRDGYGLGRRGLEQLARENNRKNGESGFLITVDCGISNHEEIGYAKELGFTVVLTDHHRPPVKLPAADVVINPHQAGCRFPCKEMAGVGVAFYLLVGLRMALREHFFWREPDSSPNLREYLDLVALGSIADVVSLTGVNRILVKAGLEVMTEKLYGTPRRPGIASLLRRSRPGNGRQAVQAEDISFRLAPRINAAGRIDDPAKALALLLETDAEKAEKLAVELDELNSERRRLENLQTTEALVNVEQKLLHKNAASLVLANDGWHQGLIGITAARLTDHYHLPSIVLALDAGSKMKPEPEKIMKGSGRSVPGLDLHRLLEQCADLLKGYGGHECAAGLSLRADKLHEFRDRFDSLVAREAADSALVPMLWIDAPASLENLFEEKFLLYYELLAPFGQGNQEPLFAVTGTRIERARVVGERHLRFSLRHGKKDSYRDGIGFNLAGHVGFLQERDADSPLVLSLRNNSFRGSSTWELQLLDASET